MPNYTNQYELNAQDAMLKALLQGAQQGQEAEGRRQLQNLLGQQAAAQISQKAASEQEQDKLKQILGVKTAEESAAGAAKLASKYPSHSVRYGPSGASIGPEPASQALAGTRKDIADQNMHNKIVRGITDDKVLMDQFRSKQALANSFQLASQADTVPKATLMELQGTLRSNANMKGPGTGAERTEQYLHSLPINIRNKIGEALGNPYDIPKTDPIYKHIQQLFNIQIGAVDEWKEKRLNAKAAGWGTFYKKRPEYKPDFDQAIKAVQEQFATPSSFQGVGGVQTPNQPPQGPISQPGASNVNIGRGPASAPKPKQIKQGNIIYTLNPQTGQYE